MNFDDLPTLMTGSEITELGHDPETFEVAGWYYSPDLKTKNNRMQRIDLYRTTDVVPGFADYLDIEES